MIFPVADIFPRDMDSAAYDSEPQGLESFRPLAWLLLSPFIAMLVGWVLAQV